MHKHLILVYNLIHKWESYTNILKMSNTYTEELLKSERDKFKVFTEDGEEGSKGKGFDTFAD